MEKKIKKQIISSEIIAHEIVVEDMQPRMIELPKLVLEKKIVSMEHAEREVKKAEQFKELHDRKARIVVSGFKNHDDTYEMTVSEFMKHATKLGEEQTELSLDEQPPEIEIGDQA